MIGDNYDNDQIAHLPLDVPKFVFNKELFEELLSHDTLLQTGDARSSYVWGRKEVVLHGHGKEPDDFFNVTKTTDAWYNRYTIRDPSEYNINPVFSPELTAEVARMLDFIRDNIPVFPAHLTLVKSTTDVPMHCDVPPEQVNFMFNKGLEPSNVKILLNPEDYDNTLFFQKYGTDRQCVDNEVKLLIKSKHMPEETNVYGWSENFHGHGGRMKDGTNRMLINIFGPLDKSRYKELLERSWAKYKDCAVTFPLGVNDSWNSK